MTGVPTVELGQGLEVGALGYGGMSLGEAYGSIGRLAALRLVHHALDAGITLLDTADVYGAGRSEELIGEVLRRRPGEAVVASKAGILPTADAAGLRVRGDGDYLRARVEGSLRRLGLERIDLFYLHRVDPRVPIEDSVAALADLVVAGKIGALGLSEVTGAELERAHAVHPIAAVQSEWSVWSRDVERWVLPTAAALGIGFVAYAPLGRGFLAGSAGELADDDLRRRFPRFTGGNASANIGVADAVAAVAGRLDATPAQVALAWVRHRARALGVTAVPIPGTRSAARIDENLASLDLVLDADALEALDGLAARTAGERNPDPESVSAGRERPRVGVSGRPPGAAPGTVVRGWRHA